MAWKENTVMTNGAMALLDTDETVSAHDNQRLCDHERFGAVSRVHRVLMGWLTRPLHQN